LLLVEVVVVFTQLQLMVTTAEVVVVLVVFVQPQVSPLLLVQHIPLQ
jgi:hypothetical protein